MLFAPVPTWKAQQLNAGRAQATYHRLVVTHESFACLVFGDGSYSWEDIASEQVWANGQALIEVYLSGLPTPDLYDEGGTAPVKAGRSEHS
jgi:hypothetical protein